MIYISYGEYEDKTLWKSHITFIRQKTKEILKYYKIKKSLFIVLTNTKSMMELNNQYRNINKDTNVIAMEMKDDPICLGEIILSFGKIEEEFKEKEFNYLHNYNIYSNFESYLLFILTHGFLHLLGYDHQNDEEEAAMNGEQINLLKKYLDF